MYKKHNNTKKMFLYNGKNDVILNLFFIYCYDVIMTQLL